MLSTLTEQTSFMPAAELPELAPRIASAPPLAPLDTAHGPPMPAPGARMRGGLPPKMLRRVREYIEAHLDEKISIESLADAIGLSMFHFARAFSSPKA
jgi:transcriptional regulator GlxA family with amidase domain